MVINYAQGNTTIWDSDVNAVMNALGGFGIISGCSISKGTGDWDIDVTSGTVFVDGTGQIPVSSGTVTITDSSGLTSGQSRITLITAQTGGTLNDTDGSAATNPDAPDIPSDEVLLGFVVVSEGDTTAADSDIVDTPALYNPPVTVIESQSPSGVGSADFTTGIDSSHKKYIFYISDLVPATDGVALYLRVSNDGGSTFESGSSAYKWAEQVQTVASGEATTGSGVGGEAQIALAGANAGIGSAAGEGVSLTVTISDPANASQFQMVTSMGTQVNNNNDPNPVHSGGAYLTAEAIDGIQFFFSSGNIKSGTIDLVGVN